MPKGNLELYRADNIFKVPQRTWGRWTLVARHVFNKTYETMMRDQGMFHHPSVKSFLLDEQWKTTSWNAAYTAADICSRGEKHILKSLENKVKGR